MSSLLEQIFPLFCIDPWPESDINDRDEFISFKHVYFMFNSYSFRLPLFTSSFTTNLVYSFNQVDSFSMN